MVKSRNVWLAAASLLFVACIPAESSAATLPLDLAAKLFGARPSAWAADLSPAGDKIVFISALPGTANLVRVMDVKTKRTTTVIGSKGTPDSIQWCEFASEDWIVCQYLADVPVHSVIVDASRIIAVNLTTKKSEDLGAPYHRAEAATIRQDDGYVISYGTVGPASVIMARDYVIDRALQVAVVADTPPVVSGIDRIALDTMAVTHIQAPNRGIDSWFTELDGTPRVKAVARYDGVGQLTGTTDLFFTAPGSNDWRKLGSYDTRNDSGMEALGVDGGSNQFYFLRKKNGREALYRQTLVANAVPAEVASNPYYDIEGIVRLQPGGPVVGYNYTDDYPEVVYFDPELEDLVADLHKVVPEDPFIGLAGTSRDGTKLLIHAASDRDPGAYYVFDKEARTLDFALEHRTELRGIPLAPVRRVDVPTADGHAIPAYLTLPEGHAPNGPAIVLPHGGPSARDTLGFDWLAQFLAARGYAVIQPNFRGSAGYGDQFLGGNAFKDWMAAISDIGASADYLVKQGIASPSRLAIVGWSYGGYAALQSAVVTPDKYKAVVAIAPVTDLARLGKDDEDFVSWNLTNDFIGKGAILRDGSPLHHASMIKAPVLLVHGDLDANVRVGHSRRMAKALKSAGNSVELLELKGLNHQLEDGTARTEMLTKIGELLDRTIGH